MRDIFCAVTDNDWFDFLRTRPNLSEINFWKPSPQTFKAVPEGGIFAFKLKAPRSKIAGYGVLTTSADAEIRLAWDAFGEGNGFSDLQSFVQKIRSIRNKYEINEYSLIGVRVLVHSVFFDESEWFDPPRDWSDSIMVGKAYPAATIAAQQLLRELEARGGGFAEPVRPRPDNGGFMETPAGGYRAPIPVKPRIGQGTFRINVCRAYANECALSGTRVTPALDAAHIRPFSDGGDHSIQNGLLLRRDIHSVFDAGFATIDENRRFVVSSKVATTFNNGNEYRRLHGQLLRDPVNPDWRPSEDFLSWHRNQRFVG